MLPYSISGLSGNCSRTERQMEGDLQAIIHLGKQGPPGPQGPIGPRGPAYELTDEDKAAILAEVQPLTQEQLELLNAMLIQDTLICFPVINAAYTIENTGNLDGYTQEWTVNAVISDIDKALIQKVEVGAGESRLAPNGVQYKWFDAKLILGETEHTAVCSGPGYNGYPPHGFVVKLTYYSTIGGTNELIEEAVKAE